MPNPQATTTHFQLPWLSLFGSSNCVSRRNDACKLCFSSTRCLGSLCPMFSCTCCPSVTLVIAKIMYRSRFAEGRSGAAHVL